MKIKIFTEGSETIGFGHLSRCSALYDEAIRQGVQVELFIQDCGYDFTENSILSSRKFHVVNWQSLDYLQKNIQKNDLCVVDSYLAPLDIYEKIAEKATRVLYIDDYGRLDYPKGIVVNPSLSTESINYPKNPDIEYLLGPEFIILRTPFLGKKRIGDHSKIERVLITFGGTDILNLTVKIANLLASQFPEVAFHIVIGKKLEDLYELNQFDNISIYNNLTDNEMCDLMVQADCAITAAGQTIYELLALQIPFCAIQVAENQSNNIDSLRKYLKKNWCITIGEKDILKKVKAVFQEVLYYPDLISNSKYIECNIIDDLGCERIIKKLINDKSVITLKKVCLSDCDILFRWANDADVRKNSFNSEKILYEDHFSWLKNKIDNMQTEMYIAYVDKKPIGQIRVEINNWGEGEIGFSIDSCFRGQGYGSMLLKTLINIFTEQMRADRLIGKVKCDNLASQKAFIKAGFYEKKVADYYIYYYEVK